MNVQSRLFDFISSKKISISDFERACGLSNGYVHKIKNSVGNVVYWIFRENSLNLILTGFLREKGRCLTIHLHILSIATIMELL